MRGVLILTLLVSLLGAGCAGSAPPPTPSTPVSSCSEERATSAVALSCARPATHGPNGSADVAAPDIPAGRTFTYVAKRAYDPDAEKIVVVAKAGPEGYLFAGGEKDDLLYEIAWGDGLYGEFGRDLSHKGHWKLLDFPLSDGATWAVSKTLNVTARAADVRTPRGVERGFLIEGTNGRTHLRYEYAPFLGTIASWLDESNGKPFESMTLKSVSNGSKWVWHAPTTPVMAGDPAMPRSLDVGKADGVVLSAGGREGSRVTVAMPDGQTWTRDFPGASDQPDGIWVNALFPATSGKWVVTVQGEPQPPVAPPVDPPASAPVGWAAASIAPVTWITGQV